MHGFHGRAATVSAAWRPPRRALIAALKSAVIGPECWGSSYACRLLHSVFGRHEFTSRNTFARREAENVCTKRYRCEHFTNIYQPRCREYGRYTVVCHTRPRVCGRYSVSYIQNFYRSAWTIYRSTSVTSQETFTDILFPPNPAQKDGTPTMFMQYDKATGGKVLIHILEHEETHFGSFSHAHVFATLRTHTASNCAHPPPLSDASCRLVQALLWVLEAHSR